MKLYIDTADIESIKKYKGHYDGITTNPVILAKSGIFDPLLNKDRILELCEYSDCVSVMVTNNKNRDGLIKEALAIAEVSSKIYVKIPATKLGLSVLPFLRDIKTNLTCVTNPIQVLYGKRFGVNIISLFTGHVETNTGASVKSFINNCVSYVENAMLLGAGMNCVQDINDCFEFGCDIVTVKPELFEKMLDNRLTDKINEDFLYERKNIIDYRKQSGSTSWYHNFTGTGVQMPDTQEQSILYEVDAKGTEEEKV